MSEVSFSRNEARPLAAAEEVERAHRLVRSSRTLMIIGGLGCLVAIIAGAGALLEGRTTWGIAAIGNSLLILALFVSQFVYVRLQAQSLSLINQLKNPSALSASSAVNSLSGD